MLSSTYCFTAVRVRNQEILPFAGLLRNSLKEVAMEKAIAKFARENYLNLPVRLTPAASKVSLFPAVYVSIRNYKNLNYMSKTGPEMKAKDLLHGVWSDDVDSDKPTLSGFSSASLMSVYAGQGSPAEISFVLQLVAHYAAKKKIKYFTISPEVGSQLQWYCDQFIGLCCLGFVSNCANKLLKTTGFRKDSVTGYDMLVKPSAPSNLLSRLKEIEETDNIAYMAMIYCVETKKDGKILTRGPGLHAMMIDSVKVQKGVRCVEVVESLGEGSNTGLRFSKLDILSADEKNRIFQCQRLDPVVSNMYPRVYIRNLSL